MAATVLLTKRWYDNYHLDQSNSREKHGVTKVSITDIPVTHTHLFKCYPRSPGFILRSTVDFKGVLALPKVNRIFNSLVPK